MKKTIRYNYPELRDMDYVLTANPGFLDMWIRRREVGWGRMFDLGVATHEGRIVRQSAGGIQTVYVAEMAPKRGDVQVGDLKIHPLSKYLPYRSRKPFVVAILRNPAYDNADIREAAVRHTMVLWGRGKARYDTGGCLKWQFPFLKDKADRWYCSEFSEHLDQTIGGFSSVGLMGKNDDNVMPSQHQFAPGMVPVNWHIEQ
jgi:hypothetical protein